MSKNIEQAFMNLPLLQQGQKLLFALLVATPLVTLPPGVLMYNALDTPRRLMLGLGIGLLLAMLLRSWALDGRLSWQSHPLDLPVGLFALGSLLSCIASPYPLVSLVGPLWTQDGFPVLCLFFGLYVACRSFIRTPEEAERAVGWLVLTGGVVAVIGLLDYITCQHILVNGKDTPVSLLQAMIGFSLNKNFSCVRLVGTLGNPMFTGTYFAMIIPLGIGAVVIARDPRWRAALASATVLMIVPFLLTSARAAWLGFLIMLLVTLGVIIYYRRSLPAMPRYLLPGICVLLAGTFLLCLLIPKVRERIHSAFDPRDGTIVTRFIYMRGSWNLFIQPAHTVQGWGVGDIKYVYPEYRPSSDIPEQGVPLNRGYSTALPHNILLMVAAESGLLGLVPFCWLLFIAFRSALRALTANKAYAWLVLGIFGMGVAWFFCNMSAFDNAATMGLMWVSLGLLAAFQPLAGKPRDLAAPPGQSGRPASDKTAQAAADSSRAPAMLSYSLSGPQVSACNIASLVLAAGIILLTLTQSIAASVFQGAIMTLTSTQSLLEPAPGEKPQPEEAFRQAESAIRSVKFAIGLTPFPDFTGYGMLCLAYKVEADIAGTMRDRDKFSEACQAMINTGNHTLRLMERDPLTRRYMAMQYLNQNHIQEAHDLVDQLLIFEPNSAEVLLLSAEIMEAEGNYQSAERKAERALNLDPTFSEVYLKLAHYQSVQMMQPNPNMQELVDSVCENYGKAEKAGIKLDDSSFAPENLFEYAAALFIDQHINDGMRVARVLRHKNTDLYKELLTKVTATYKLYKKPQVGAKIVKELSAELPPNAGSATSNVPLTKAPFQR